MRNVLVGIGLLLVGLMPAVSFAERGVALPEIVVTGEGYREVAPDQLRWSLEVRTVDPDLDAAAERHEREVRDLLDFVRGLEIPEATLETTRMQFGENWVYRAGERQQNGYFASTVVTFIMDDLDDYLAMWRGLSRRDAVSVRDVSWMYSQADSLRDELRQEAVLRARERAKVLTDALGVSLGTLRLIDDLESGSMEIPMRRNQMMRAMGDDPGEVLAPGQLSFRVFVRVVFEIE